MIGASTLTEPRQVGHPHHVALAHEYIEIGRDRESIGVVILLVTPMRRLRCVFVDGASLRRAVRLHNPGRACKTPAPRLRGTGALNGERGMSVA